MTEIIAAIKEWNAVRKNSVALKQLFSNVKGFKLDMSLFPAGIPLHAYPAIKNKTLYFIVISEENDVRKDPKVLEKQCFWIPCLVQLSDSQEISQVEALERIDSWNRGFNVWIDSVAKEATGIYQNFFIPTYDLLPQTYKVYFALKDDALNPSLKAADLVLKSQSNLFFDTIRFEPPYKDRVKYYILDL